MPSSILPIRPVAASDAATTALVLRPGATIDATVVKLLEANLVRIAIAGLMLDVTSQVPLQAGQALRFAVAPHPNGLRLVIAPAAEGVRTTAAMPTASAVPPAAGPGLTPAEAQAVASAVTQAASRQGGLSPLFANLATAPAAALGPAMRLAVTQVLATRLQGEGPVNGAMLKSAAARSGLFLEQHLGAGTPPAPQAPDLKAALLGLRHALAKIAGVIGQPPPSVPSPLKQAPALLAPPLAPEGPEHGLDVAAPKMQALVPHGSAVAAPRAMTTAALLGLVSQALAAPPRGPVPVGTAPDAGVARTVVPPPPYRGAAPAAQPVAAPSLPPDSGPASVVHRLLADTDAALARQTLLQVASLPGPDAALPRSDQAAARWLFEIPIAVPQGTAVAQFEIFRDGQRQDDPEPESGGRVWRARFSLDVEPAGPVHALVSLTGGAASVRLWAERPLTAARLRSEAPDLSRALREAALEPGDIVVGEGAPPAPAAPAGHFWDRLS